MERYTSKTIITDSVVEPPKNLEVSLSFTVNVGTEEINIKDELLTNFNVSKARATSIFLDSSYIAKRVTFETYHFDGLRIGNYISIDGSVYVVESIIDTIAGAKISSKITAQRWE